MRSRALDRYSLLLKIIIALALVCAASMFSYVFDWNDSKMLISSDQAVWSAASLRPPEPCVGDSRKDSIRDSKDAASLEELRPLDPSEEELLSFDKILAPAEVLELNEGIEQMRHAAGAVAPDKPVAQKIESSTGSADVVADAARSALSGPRNLAPQRLADLRDRIFVRLHWDKVEGSQQYHVKAWQVLGAKKIVLFDARTRDTEVHVRPRINSPVHWEVAAVDAKGQPGEVAGPVTFQLLGGPAKTRLPARAHH